MKCGLLIRKPLSFTYSVEQWRHRFEAFASARRLRLGDLKSQALKTVLECLNSLNDYAGNYERKAGYDGHLRHRCFVKVENGLREHARVNRRSNSQPKPAQRCNAGTYPSQWMLKHDRISPMQLHHTEYGRLGVQSIVARSWCGNDL